MTRQCIIGSVEDELLHTPESMALTVGALAAKGAKGALLQLQVEIGVIQNYGSVDHIRKIEINHHIHHETSSRRRSCSCFG